MLVVCTGACAGEEHLVSAATAGTPFVLSIQEPKSDGKKEGEAWLDGRGQEGAAGPSAAPRQGLGAAGGGESGPHVSRC